MSESIVLKVTGMKCGGCEVNAKHKLESLNGVIQVIASHKNHKIEIKFESKNTHKEAIIRGITEAGYNVV